MDGTHFGQCLISTHLVQYHNHSGKKMVKIYFSFNILKIHILTVSTYSADLMLLSCLQLKMFTGQQFRLSENNNGILKQRALG